MTYILVSSIFYVLGMVQLIDLSFSNRQTFVKKDNILLLSTAGVCFTLSTLLLLILGVKFM